MPEKSWKPAIAVALAIALAAGAYLLGAWMHRGDYVCVMTSAGTVVCGRSSGPVGAASPGQPPLVQPQWLSYQEGRRKVSETACRDDKDGTRVCRTTEYYE
ncbi:MAG: hypothetical protein LBG06_02355 [Deltaproteobacteria bacterium]|nr:hypothetical protein [Deltaproteobacteria bacterium]